MPAQAPRQLISWKEIAEYLGRDVRTVVRWEKDKNLPVHRVPGGKRQAVYAFSDELDRWLRGDGEVAATATLESRAAELVEPRSPAMVRRRIRGGEWALLIGVALICFSLLGFLFRPKQPVATVLRLTRISTAPGIPGGPAVSPDGRQIAYTFLGRGESKWHVYVQLIGAGEAVRLTNADQQEGAPAWSPDGRFIAFPTYSDTNAAAIDVVPALGGNARQVVHIHDPEAMWYVTWTPDGKGVVYGDRDSESEPVKDWIAHLDGGERKEIFSAPDRLTHEVFGHYSPDGRHFALIRGRAFPDSLYVMPAEGGEPRKIFSGHLGRSFTWTADSRELIVQVIQERTNSSLVRISLEGGPAVPVITSTSDVTSPSLPASGQGLLFQQYQQDANIWRVDTSRATKAVRVLDSVDREVDPACSPDGKRLAYLSYRDGADIWTADADGANARRLTFIAEAPRKTSGTPDWSPDGRVIVFTSAVKGRVQISFVDTGTGAMRHLASTSNDEFPHWSRDGRFLYFTSDRSGQWEIWKIPAEGGTAVQITRNGGYVSQASPDGAHVYYSKPKEDGI
jgi:Tol biopolymer transport system component